MIQMFYISQRTKTNSQNLVLTLMLEDRVKHCEIVINADGNYVFGDKPFKTLTELVAYHRRSPYIFKRRSGAPLKVFLDKQVPNDCLYMIKPWFLLNLGEDTVNR